MAEAAVAETLAFVDNTAMVDRHLADQLLLPLALAHGHARFTTDHLTLHTVTNAELLRQWLDTKIEITGDLDGPAEIDVTGIGFAANRSLEATRPSVADLIYYRPARPSRHPAIYYV